DRGHVVGRPPVTNLRAVALECRYQIGNPRIAAVPRGGEPEPAEHRARFRLPLQVHLACVVAGEHPPDEVPLAPLAVSPGPVSEELTRGGVGGQHVPAAALDQGRVRLKALYKVVDAGT